MRKSKKKAHQHRRLLVEGRTAIVPKMIPQGWPINRKGIWANFLVSGLKLCTTCIAMRILNCSFGKIEIVHSHHTMMIPTAVYIPEKTKKAPNAFTCIL